MDYNDTTELIKEEHVKPYIYERRQLNKKLEEQIYTLSSQINDTKTIAKENRRQLNTIKEELARYKGMVGGALFILSALMTILMFAKDWIIGKH